MTRSTLHRRAARSATLAAAAAGALTAGLVSALGHVGPDKASGGSVAVPTVPSVRPTLAPSTSRAAKNGEGEDEGADEQERTTKKRSVPSSSTAGSGGGNVASVPQNAPPQGGSHGS